MSDIVVDAHAHIYHMDEVRYPMIEKPHRPPSGTGDAAHLQRQRQEHSIHRVVLVQTGSAYKWDNRLLIDTARQLQEWAAGVCNLNPADPDSVETFTRMATQDNVRALRLEATADGRYDHQGARRLLARAQEIGAVICAHLRPQHLPELDQLLEAFPEVSVVLDHCAYPDGDAGPESDTVRAVTALARHRNLYAKLTFLVTGSKQPYPFVDTQAIAQRMLEAFGAERCMWGSDFPCELWLKDRATYGQHLAVVREELGLTPVERAQVLGGTAFGVFFRQ
jgi:predicted TIM-barrel fold metal-dependent hydrolase